MKKFNPQLDDAMILALADSFDMGVDFSHATNTARIPEMLINEAKEYWDLLNKQKEVIHQIFPEDSIVDSILRKMDAPSAELPRVAAPSPYMKYVMAFAVPLSIFVMVIGVVYRNSTNPSNLSLNNPTLNTSDFSDENTGEKFESGSIQEVSSAPKMAKMQIDSSDNSDSPRALMSGANMRMMAASVPVDEAENIKDKDPKQLLAMLTDTGSHESESDTKIDDEFDARISELNSKVISNDTNPYDETK